MISAAGSIVLTLILTGIAIYYIYIVADAKNAIIRELQEEIEALKKSRRNNRRIARLDNDGEIIYVDEYDEYKEKKKRG